jgi:hypothetical protein
MKLRTEILRSSILTAIWIAYRKPQASAPRRIIRVRHEPVLAGTCSSFREAAQSLAQLSDNACLIKSKLVQIKIRIYRLLSPQSMIC